MQKYNDKPDGTYTDHWVIRFKKFAIRMILILIKKMSGSLGHMDYIYIIGVHHL